LIIKHIAVTDHRFLIFTLVLHFQCSSLFNLSYWNIHEV